MSEPRTDLRDEVRRLIEDDLEAGGEHPPAEELVAYHRGSLPAARAEALREHLAGCAECTALLLDFDEHWAGAATAEPEPAYQPWHLRPGPPWALAAALGAVALGLTGWIAMRDEPPREPAVTSGHHTRNLEPESNEMRGETEKAVVALPAGNANLVLVLSADDLPAGAACTAILVRDGETIARVEGTLDDAPQFTLIVPREVLLPGEYRIALRGPEGTPELEYEFRVPERGAEP